MQSRVKKVLSSFFIVAVCALMFSYAYYENIHYEQMSTDSIESFGEALGSLKDSGSLESEFSSCRLIVESDSETFEKYGANRCVSYGNTYVLKYSSAGEAKRAYNNFKKDSNIEYVDEDSLFEVSTVENSDSDDFKLNVQKLSDKECNKENTEEITVAVLDSGYDYSDENPYKDKILYEKALNFSGESSLDDKLGHGSLMADIIINSSDYNVSVLPIKIVSSDGKTSASKVLAGLQYAIDNDVDIINISLTSYGTEYSSIINDKITEAKNKGIFTVVSAGNFSSDTSKFTPANSEDAIVVSAVTTGGEWYVPTDYSNYGDTVDFTSLGAVNIESYNNKYDSSVSGTSVSAALVSGMIADYRATFPTLSYDEVLEDLQRVAFDILDDGKDIYSGYGFLTDDFISRCVKDSETELDKSLLSADWKDMTDEEFNDKFISADETICKMFIDSLSKSDLDELLDRKTFLTGEYINIEYDSNDVEERRTYYERFIDFLNSDDYANIFVIQDTTYGSPSNKSNKVYITVSGNKDNKGKSITGTGYFTAKCASNNGEVEISGKTDGGCVIVKDIVKGGKKHTAIATEVGQWGIGGLIVKKGEHTYLKESDWWSKKHGYDWSGGFVTKSLSDGSIAGEECGGEEAVFSFMLGADDVTQGDQVYTLKFTTNRGTKEYDEVVVANPTCTEKGQKTKLYDVICKECKINGATKADRTISTGDVCSGYPKDIDPLNHYKGGGDNCTSHIDTYNSLHRYFTCNRCNTFVTRNDYWVSLNRWFEKADSTDYEGLETMSASWRIYNTNKESSKPYNTLAASTENNSLSYSYVNPDTTKWVGNDETKTINVTIFNTSNSYTKSYTRKKYNLTVTKNINAFSSLTGGGTIKWGATTDSQLNVNATLSTYNDNGVIKTGYLWNGWTITNNASLADASAGSTKVNQMPVGNVTVQANATAKSINIKYHNVDKNGNDIDNVSKSYSFGGSNALANASDLGFANKGYHFVGWVYKPKAAELEPASYTYSGGTTIVDSWLVNVYDNTLVIDGETINCSNHTVDLYAVWENNWYYINYDGNNHTGQKTNVWNSGYDMPDQRFEYDVEENLNANQFAKVAEFTFVSNGGTFKDTGKTDNYKILQEFEFDDWYCNETETTKTRFADKEEVLNLTSEHQKTLTFKAQWIDNGIVLPEVEKDNAKFLGWFLQPQGSHGDYVEGEAGLAGIDGDTYKVGVDNPSDKFTLYAWWNENPTYTDIYEGTFYEGQKVSYSDLLKLIGVSDFEDDYRNSADALVKEVLEANPSNETKTEAEKDKVEIDEGVLPDISEDKGYATDESDRSKISAEINPAKLDVKITGITYTRDLDGITWYSGGAESKELKEGYDDIIAHGLITDTTNLGYFYVDYEVTDDGIYNGATEILKRNGYKVDSPITIKYRRKCVILYNNPPILTIDDTVFMFTDERESVNTVPKLKNKLRPFVHESDAQDNVPNLPWWSAKEKTQELYDNVHVVTPIEVKDVSVSTSWAKDNPERAEELTKITTLKEICDLSDEEYGVITGYKVIYDTVDQFGKYASKKIKSGYDGVQVTSPDGWRNKNDFQTKDDRTLQVILINPELDTDMIDANTMKQLRYINYGYLGTLGDSYWKEYAYKELENSFRSNATNPTSVQNGVFRNEDTNNEIPLQVNDYSK